MGGEGYHKLLAEFEGVPLIRRSVLVALKCSASSITVVSGYQREKIEKAISGLPVGIVFNADYLLGMASSLVAACSAASIRDAEGVLVMLADMPGITPHHLDKLISVFLANEGRSIVRAVCGEIPGNPAILPRSLVPMILGLRGDIGARQIIEASGYPVVGVAIGHAALLDVDTPNEVIAAGGILVR